MQILSELLGYVPLCTRPSQLFKNLTIRRKYRIFQKCALWETSAGLLQIAKSRTSMYAPVAICSKPYYFPIYRVFLAAKVKKD